MQKHEKSVSLACICLDNKITKYCKAFYMVQNWIEFVHTLFRTQ